jgi:hypothetical protein
MARAQVGFRVDGRPAPGPVARRSRTLAKLAGRSRQLDRSQTRALRKRGFAGRDLDERVGASFDFRCERLEELREPLVGSRQRSQPDGGLAARGASGFDVVCGGNRILRGQ